MRKVIRLGDPTDHGGKVVASSAAARPTLDGVPLALLGDACSCPRRGHEPCTIAEGDPGHVVDGMPVAYEGHRTSCGAVLIATAAACGKA